MAQRFDRRELLRGTAGAAMGLVGCSVAVSRERVAPSLVSALARESPPEIVPIATLRGLRESHAHFPLGVMSGDATADAAIVWTRYTGAAPLALWLRERLDEHATLWPVTVGPDGFTHLDARDLRPGGRYRYRVWRVCSAGRRATRGPTGRFRTALPADSLEPITFAGTSCTNQYMRPYPALAHAAARHDLSFVLHVGDHVYCDFSYDLSAYRNCYADAWPSYGMKSFHASAGMIAAWDDHEVTNNWDPETLCPVRVGAARRAFFEHHPIRRDVGHPNRMWRRFGWGRTADVFVLDTRSERKPSTRSSRDAVFLSAEQFEWLELELARSGAVFKFVVTSVPISTYPSIFQQVRGDRWEGYAAQRERLLGHLERERISGVWFLSGDFHFGCISRVEPSGPRSTLREILMGPGRQVVNPFWSVLDGGQWDALVPADNVTVIRADPGRRRLEVDFVGADGSVLASRAYDDAVPALR